MVDLPLWLLVPALLCAIPLAAEVGYRLFGRITPRASDESTRPPDEGWGQLVGGAMSLLTLLLAFTVSMATDRYNTRLRLVSDEANAISTTYLRAQTFQEPTRGRLSVLIGQYAHDRRATFVAGDNRAKIAQAEVAADASRNLIWAETLDGLNQHQEGIATTAILQATNQMFDLAASRQAALEARVPPRILLALVAYSILTAGLVGYSLAWRGPRHLVASTLVFLMVAMTVALIYDLDRPRSGGITVSELPLERVSAGIAMAEVAKRNARVSSDPAPKSR